MEKVLLIGNIPRDGSMLTALNHAGFLVKEFTGRSWGWPGLNKVRDEHPDLILIEEELALVDGLDVLAALRHSTTVPIIVTGSGDEETVVSILLQGADAYLPSTVSSDILLARINALLRRHAISSAVA
jgi:two-component system response regulator CpxR